MSNQNKTILVTGATGNQGGSVAKHLLANGWTVRAFTRNKNKPAAQALADAGAEIYEGDFDHVETLKKAAEGVYGLYSVQVPLGFEGEVNHGKIVADVTKAAGVQHMVYSSVGGAERGTGIPHFDAKWVVEEYIRGLEIPVTVLRPAYFMENFNFQRQGILNGQLTSMGLNSGRSVQMIAVDDIGAFATLAFNNPTEYIGKALEIAGDDLDEDQVAAAFAKTVGRPVQLVQPEGPPAYEDMVTMVNWFNDYGYEADINSLKAIRPSLLNFEEWLENSDWTSN